MIHKSRILKPTFLQSLLSPFLPAYFISTESVGMEKIYFRVLCKQTTKQRKKEIAEREQTTCQPRQQSLYICIWITVVNKSWGSNSKSARALKKKSHESERILKITVVYKTQIWQDHQSVYRNTNTIMKRVREQCSTLDMYRLLSKRTWGWTDDDWDIFLLCLWRSITFSHNVFVLRFNILSK